jgi:hypothetical protein
MTDFRALCAELLDEFDYHTDWSDAEEVKDRARAALAEQPVGPTDEELDQLEEMLWDRYKTLGFQGEEFMYEHSFGFALADFARWGQPAIAPPADGEVGELVSFLTPSREQAGAISLEAFIKLRRAATLLQQLSAPVQPPADGEVAELVAWLLENAVQAADASQPRDAGMLTWAAQVVGEHAELLEQGHPTPIPVAERLPGPGEWVWHCYAGVRLWELGRYNGRQFFIGDGPESQPATYWLPANALPVPAND